MVYWLSGTGQLPAMTEPVSIFRRIAKVMTADVFAARMQAGTVGWPG